MIYRYKLELTWTNNAGVIFNIDSSLVKTFFIKSDYENSILPMIVLGMKIDNDLYDDIILNKDNSFFSFTLKKYKETGEYIMEESYIGIQCMYVTLDDINYERNVKDSKNKDDHHRSINIGLIRTDLLKQTHCNVSTIGSGLAVGFLISDTNIEKLLIEPTMTSYSGVLPPMDRTADLISFLNEEAGPLYSTPYRFFIDHNRSYLLSSSGNAVYAKGEKEFIVSIEILDPTDTRIRYDGTDINLSNKVCKILVDARRTKFYIDNTKGVQTNRYTLIGKNGSIKNVSIDLMNRKEMPDVNKYIFENTKFSDIYKFNAELNNKIFDVMLDDCDNSVFTINRKFSIQHIDKYKKYSGNYLLVYKVEMFQQDKDFFKSSATLKFKKIPE